ncbi:hypothetical protein [Bacillus sp. CECT 9360]|uniref:hypothetical protein n=1 Tax=Bacillus sp. CECT 9360 TaxID=2845821 RepID=UPI001E2844F4|nr:hypothetical protein [Bacillus sp. CECT 9360]CAH0344513.1 hypothetical protein BCI9360_00769 [Bacillus sp. CECT 9360]
MMGYILPVTQYEYIQYANRTVGAEKQPDKFVQGVMPIRPITFIQSMDKETENVEKGESLQNRKPMNAASAYFSVPSLKSKIPEHIITQATAELTGKGGNINVKI